MRNWTGIFSLWAFAALMLVVLTVRREDHWLPILARYLPPLTWGLMLALLLALFRLTRTPILVLPTLVCLALWLAVSGFQLRPSRPGSLRVMTWNIHAGLAGPERIGAFLAASGCDLILLQEARRPARGGPDPVPALRAALPCHDIARSGELVILSRFPIRAVGELPPVAEYRPGLMASLEVHGRTVQVIDLHYVTGDPGKVLGPGASRRQRLMRTVQVRAEQTDLLVQLLGEGPTLLAGDFNCPPRSYTHRELSSRLRDAFSEAGLGFGLSYPARTPLWRIDHLFWSRHFRVRSCRVVDTGLSDHRAVIAEADLGR
ncbi:MAG: endonuclease/exonuclease/phosphatase family protein [Candidatus Eremiobacterota bacterium]